MPLLQCLENRLERNQRQLRRLLAERDSLHERLGGAPVKDEPLGTSQSDSGAGPVRRPSDSGVRSQPQRRDSNAGSSQETVFLPSAAERELGLSLNRHQAKFDSDSDSTASAELSRPRRHSRMKRERESGRVKRERESDQDSSAPESERRPGPSGPRRRLTVVKEEPDSRDSEVDTETSRPRRTRLKQKRSGSACNSDGQSRTTPAVKEEQDWYLDVNGSQGQI